VSSQGKVNILLQSYISQHRLEDFALVSDQAYVAQNAGRIVRALFEIALSNKWAKVSHVLAGLSKVIERRMWPNLDHPLKQFNLQPQLLHNLSQWADDWMVEDLAVMDADRAWETRSYEREARLCVEDGCPAVPNGRNHMVPQTAWTRHPQNSGSSRTALHVESQSPRHYRTVLALDRGRRGIRESLKYSISPSDPRRKLSKWTSSCPYLMGGPLRTWSSGGFRIRGSGRSPK
jgi:hypothetical protein